MMYLYEYFEYGIFFACVSVLYNMIKAYYFVTKNNDNICNVGAKMKKPEENILQLVQLININVNLSMYGLMFAWVICWPALLIFKIIQILTVIFAWLAKNLN